MSDMFNRVLGTARDTARDLAERGRELAKKGQELAEQLGETAQDKVDDFNNGSLLGQLETRAVALESEMYIRRQTGTDGNVLWSADFGPDSKVGTGPDFKTAVEQALELNVPALVPDAGNDTQHG